MKLFLVEGLRHTAIVMASSERESIEIVTRAYGGVEDDRVLFGAVGDWEGPRAKELKLPRGWKIAEEAF